MSGEIINRVANSALITIDLEDYYPKGERVYLILKTGCTKASYFVKKNSERL